MTQCLVNEAHLYLEDAGQGEPILFCHGLLFNLRMWDAQVSALRNQFRCVRFDFRGQGRSEVTAGGYDMDSLAADTACIIREVIGQPCHLVGLSMGGFVGIRVAARHPRWVRSLSLLDSSAGLDDPANQRRFSHLNLAARLFGVKRTVPHMLPYMFGKSFLNDPERAGELRRWSEHLARINRRGAIRAANGVIHRSGADRLLNDIRARTLVICGEEDQLTPLSAASALARWIPDARLEVLSECGHMSAIEQPERVNQLLLSFLQEG